MFVSFYCRNPLNAPQNKISNYVVPSQKKREDVRYEIRMKMLRASAMQVQMPFQDASKRKRPKSAALPRKNKNKSTFKIGQPFKP